MDKSYIYIDESEYEEFVKKIQEFGIPGTDMIISALNLQENILFKSVTPLHEKYQLSIYYIFLKMRYHVHGILSMLACDNFTCANILLRSLFDHLVMLFFLCTRNSLEDKNAVSHEFEASSRRNIFRNLHKHSRSDSNSSNHILDLSKFGLKNDPDHRLMMEELKRIELNNVLLPKKIRDELNLTEDLNTFFMEKSNYWKAVNKIAPKLTKIWDICKENDKYIEKSNFLLSTFSAIYFQETYKTLFTICCQDTHFSLIGVEHIVINRINVGKLPLLILANIKSLIELLLVACLIYEINYKYGMDREIIDMINRNRRLSQE